MKIKRFMCGPIDENGYVLYHHDGGKCFLIDPGYESELYVDFVKKHELDVKEILLTHLHRDHTGQADRLSELFSCTVAMHGKDSVLYDGRVDHPLDDGEILDLEEEKIKVLHTPGHTKGSVCFLSKKSRVCFTGDTIFDTDLGRTDLEGGSEKDLRNSCRNIVDKWENDITIWPGHEGAATMKQVREFNREFNQMIKGK